MYLYITTSGYATLLLFRKWPIICGQYCICRLISPLETVLSSFSHHRCVWIWWITTPRRPEEKQYTLYTLLVPGWIPFFLQNGLNSSWHRFNKVLETFLRDFGPYWHDSITQLLQICLLHIHDENLSFHHIPKLLYWIEIWGLIYKVYKNIHSFVLVLSPNPYVPFFTVARGCAFRECGELYLLYRYHMFNVNRKTAISYSMVLL